MAGDNSELPGVLRPDTAEVPGTEPWSVRGDAAGVLLLHGLTGSPWEVMPLARHLARAGRTVAVPLLAGHGKGLEDLARSRWQDWLASSRRALEWLEVGCDRVHIVGLSMGGVLGLLLASQRMRARPGSLTLLAPAFTLGPWVELALRGVGRLGWPAVLGKARTSLPAGPAPGLPAMPVAPLGSLLELQEVVRCARPRPLCPVLMLHGTADATIPPAPAAKVARELLGPSLRVCPVEGAGHLLPRTAQAERVLARVEAFVGEGR